MSDSPQFLTVDQFAAQSGMSVATIRRYIRTGKLECLQPGGFRCRVAIPRTALMSAIFNADSLPPTNSKEVNIKNRKLSGPTPRWRR
jgi:hypothetical protein